MDSAFIQERKDCDRSRVGRPFVRRGRDCKPGLPLAAGTVGGLSLCHTEGVGVLPFGFYRGGSADVRLVGRWLEVAGMV